MVARKQISSNGHRNTVGQRDHFNVDCVIGDPTWQHFTDKCLSKRKHRQEIKGLLLAKSRGN